MSKVKAKHKQVVFDADEASVACGELERCREVLLIGLASYGEVERLSDVQSNYASELYAPDEDDCMRPINPELMVQYEDRSLGTVSNFAQALKYLDILMRKMLQAGEPPDSWGLGELPSPGQGGPLGIIEPEEPDEAGQPSGHPS